jgi:hypothetical protein
MCRSALRSLQDNPGREWIVLWAGTLGLLRVAVECLERDKNETIRRNYNKIFRDINENNQLHNRGFIKINCSGKKIYDKSHWCPKIYYQFILDDRNKMLHEAVSKVAQDVKVPGAIIELDRGTGEQRSSTDGTAAYRYNFASGAFCGEDSRDVTQAAIEWIDNLICRVESMEIA